MSSQDERRFGTTSPSGLARWTASTGNAATVAVAAAVLAMAGCVVPAVQYTGPVYYAEGAEETLEALDLLPVGAGDALLADMERAMALLELGRYEDSHALLARVIEQIDAGAAPGSGEGSGRAVRDDGVYVGEAFERVLVHTLALLDLLALNRIEEAEGAARAVLAAADGAPCDACAFAFSRYAAAVAFEAAGAVDLAVDALTGAVAERPDVEWLQAELERVSAPDVAASAAGFLPPPAAGSGRRVIAFLLLGRGPEKVAGPSFRGGWPDYVPREPAVVAARLRLDGGTASTALTLTDVDALAEASLAARRALAGEPPEGSGWSVELRHWATLPAVCQVARLPVPVGVDRCEIVYLNADGSDAWREEFELPQGWREGPLFVVRRVP